jgi:hypothetical protein
MSYTSTLVLLLHLIYLSYPYNVYRACSFFMNLDLFCIGNACVIYKKIRYLTVDVTSKNKFSLSSFQVINRTLVWELTGVKAIMLVVMVVVVMCTIMPTSSFKTSAVCGAQGCKGALCRTRNNSDFL